MKTSHLLWLAVGGGALYVLTKKTPEQEHAAAQASAAASVGVLAPGSIPSSVSQLLMTGLGLPTVPSSVTALGPTLPV